MAALLSLTFRALGRIGSIMHYLSSRQSGFTLIEALIAFLILTIGILGAALFHSNLLSEHSESIGRQEAASIAESQIEAIREEIKTASSQTAVQDFFDSFGVVSVPTTSGIFFVSLSGSAPNYSLSVTDNEEIALSFPIYAGLQNFPTELEGNVSLSPSGTGYGGEIPLPTGTLTTLDRAVVVDIGNAQELASLSSPSYKVYDVGDDRIIAGIEIEGEFVQLVELQDESNEILVISGQILNDPNEPIGKNFGCTIIGSSKGYCADTGGLVEDDVIDITATAGAGCVIYELVDYSLGTIPEDLNEFSPDAGNYLCLVGTGWNGQISPGLVDIQGSCRGTDCAVQLADFSSTFVCAPQFRAGRYEILSPSDLFSFEDAVNSLGSGTRNANYWDAVANLVGSAAVANVGQSGMARLYFNADPSISVEGLYQDNFLFRNPEYSYPDEDYPLFGAEYEVYGNSSAYSGIGQDLTFSSFNAFAVDDTAIANEPGDLAYQNFYIFKKPSGPSGSDYADCATYGTEQLPSVLVSLDSNAGNYHGYLAGLGFPGENYVVSGATESQGLIDAYNKDFADHGSLVLGYALASQRVSGEIIVTNENNAGIFPGVLNVVAQPQPEATIVCSATGTVTEEDASRRVEYECLIPEGWYGDIVVYPAASTAAGTVYRCNGTDDFVSGTDASDESNISYYYYYDTVTERSAASAAGGSYHWDGFSISTVASVGAPITSALTGQDFFFSTSGNSCSMP